MNRRIILFKGMNIGGVRAPVSEQKAMATDLGLANPRTLLASGNLIVDCDRAPQDLEAEIEAETERRFGRRIDTIARSDDQWAAMMRANPFEDQGRSDPTRLLVMVMKAGVKPGGLEAIRDFAEGGEAVEEAADALWFWHPNGLGTSRMAAKAQLRLIGLGTGRNWSTVGKIAELLGVEP